MLPEDVPGQQQIAGTYPYSRGMCSIVSMISVLCACNVLLDGPCG